MSKEHIYSELLFHYYGYVGFENFPVLKEVFESSYDKVTIADLNPSENRPIVLWGMSYFKYRKGINIMKKTVTLIFSLLGLLSSIALFVILVIIENLKRDYMYGTISSFGHFALSVLVAIFIPLICVFINLYALKANKVLKILLPIVSYSTLIVCIVLTVIVCGISRGGISSYTEDINNYKKFDDYVIRSIERYCDSEILPPVEKITADSIYFYNYNYGFLTEFYDIQLKAFFDNAEEFNAEISRLDLLTALTVKNKTYAMVSDDNRFLVTITVNENSKCLTYFVQYN